MLYKFDTDDVERAKAALLLYAMYKSRGTNSPLNGLETWDRVAAYIRASGLKSCNTAEFVQNFCKKAQISSIKPHYLSTGEPVVVSGTEELICSTDYKDYRLDIMEDNEVYKIICNESLYIIMLVRERIQREKFSGEEIERNEN